MLRGTGPQGVAQEFGTPRMALGAQEVAAGAGALGVTRSLGAQGVALGAQEVTLGTLAVPRMTARCPHRPWASRWSSCPTSPAPSPAAASPRGWHEPPRPLSPWAARWARGTAGDPKPVRAGRWHGGTLSLPGPMSPMSPAGGGGRGHDQPAGRGGAGVRQGAAGPDLLLPPQPHHHPGGAGTRPGLPARAAQLHRYGHPRGRGQAGTVPTVPPCHP